MEKVKLSQSILDMKFMKKTKEKFTKDQEDAESKEMYSNQITDEMKKDGNIIFREASITFCKGLIDGRLSFGGMNPDIEKMMENDYNKLLNEAEKRKEKDVTDEEMAKGTFSSAKESSTLNKLISNKFKTKKRKREFKKPSTNEALY